MKRGYAIVDKQGNTRWLSCTKTECEDVLARQASGNFEIREIEYSVMVPNRTAEVEKSRG